MPRRPTDPAAQIFTVQTSTANLWAGVIGHFRLLRPVAVFNPSNSSPCRFMAGGKTAISPVLRLLRQHMTSFSIDNLARTRAGSVFAEQYGGLFRLRRRQQGLGALRHVRGFPFEKRPIRFTPQPEGGLTST